MPPRAGLMPGGKRTPSLRVLTLYNDASVKGPESLRDFAVVIGEGGSVSLAAVGKGHQVAATCSRGLVCCFRPGAVSLRSLFCKAQPARPLVPSAPVSVSQKKKSGPRRAGRGGRCPWVPPGPF